MANEFDELHPNSLAGRDYATQQDLGDVQKLKDDVLATSKRPRAQMSQEARQGTKWPGGTTTLDYFRYRLYELGRNERKEFLSDRLQYPILDHCADDEWSEKTVDKLVCTKVLLDAGVPTIPVLAVIDRSGAGYDETPTISTGSELADFLHNTDLPLFGKPNRLLGSFGAFRIDDIDADMVTVSGEQPVSADVIVDELIGDVPYVLQHVVQNHEIIRAFATGLATIRTVNFVSTDSVRMGYAIYKIPAGDNIADNFWRKGNLVAEIDHDSGVIRRVVSGTGPDQIEHTIHPTTGDQLVGLQLPFWPQVVDLNRQTAEVFSSIRYQSQDIAITDDGPIVVEVNSGGSFDLPQVATGRGFLTKENKKFFESCGVNFRQLK